MKLYTLHTVYLNIQRDICKTFLKDQVDISDYYQRLIVRLLCYYFGMHVHRQTYALTPREDEHRLVDWLAYDEAQSNRIRYNKQQHVIHIRKETLIFFSVLKM